MSEIELVKRLKNKETESFDFLYNRYSSALYGMILKILPDHFIASKVLVKSFEESWKRIDTYDDSKSKFFTWLVKLTIQKCNEAETQSREYKLGKVG